MSRFVLTKTVRQGGYHDVVTARALASEDGRTVEVAVDEEEAVALEALVRALVSFAGGEAGTVEVTRTEVSDDCETCGSFTDTTLDVTVGARPIASFTEDGHLGGGDDIHDVDALFVRVAEALGHTVAIRRTGRLILDVSRRTDRLEAETDRSLVDANTDLALELRLDGEGRDLPSAAYLETLLANGLPPVARLTVCAELQPSFVAMLKTLGRGPTLDAGRVDALLANLVVDGSIDQARRAPVELLAAYFAGDPTADAMIAATCPRSTFFDLCRVGLERGIAIPDKRLPHALRKSPSA